MKALVTGGAGFIGSHITQKLLKDGHSVVVLDNFFSGKESNLSFVSQYAIRDTQYELIRGDIRDYEACMRACHGVDVVFHQAALRSVPRSMTMPREYHDVNINGMLNMLKAAVESGAKRFVFASSSSVYGNTDEFPEKETAYPAPISPYALTKLVGEHYCHLYHVNYGLETVSLRYFNVFGPRQALDDDYAVVVPKFITCLLNDDHPPVFGDGNQSRDFTYIDNVVQANILAGTKEEIKCEVCNVANGQDHSVRELAQTLNKIIGKDIEPVFLDKRAGDVYKTLADITKIEKILGYTSQVNFEEGLSRTVKHFKKLMVRSQ